MVLYKKLNSLTMHIRKNTLLDITIFDVSTMDATEKKDIYDQVILMHTDSLRTISTKDVTTRLVIPAIFSQGVTEPTSSMNGQSKRCLFNDILGSNKTTNRDCFGPTRIIGDLNPTLYVTNKKKHRVEKILPVDEEKIFITENKTFKLLEKHNKKDINKTGKTLQPDLDSIRDKRSVLYYEGTWHDSPEAAFSKFDPNTSILKKIDRILFVDTTYSLSEMKIAFELKDLLFRTTYNATSCIRYFNSLHNYSQASIHMKGLFQKYDVKGPTIWKRHTENGYSHIDEEYSIRHAYDSLFDENEIEITTKDNIFIPVTFVLFLENANRLFQPNVSIIREDHTIRNPQFFVNKCATHSSLGYPNFTTYSKDSKWPSSTSKQQSRVFTNIPMDAYSLKTTLTSIPYNLSTRLLKSKLKAVKQSEANKDAFYFFTPGQIEKISEKGKHYADSFFCIRFDRLLDLSYYTHAIQLHLVNRFANEYYGDYMRIEDFIGFGKFIEMPFKGKLTTLYDDLVSRQECLADKFNSSDQTILSKEMFDYEIANLFYLYILRTSGSKLCTIRTRERWNLQSMDDLTTALSKNHYLFSRDMIDKIYNSNAILLRTDSSSKAYIMEAMFRLVRTLPRDELLAKINEIAVECDCHVDKVIKTYLASQKFSKDLTKIVTEDRTYEIQNKFHRVLLNHRSKHFTINYNMWRLLHENESLNIIPLLIGTTSLRNFIEDLTRILNTYVTYFKVGMETVKDLKLIEEDGKSTNLLTNTVTHNTIEKQYDYYYSADTPEINLVKRLMKDNAAAKVKIVILEEFTDLLISTFTKEYFSNRKE